MIAPATNPRGSEDGAPRYGSGSVNKNTDIGTTYQRKITKNRMSCE